MKSKVLAAAAATLALGAGAAPAASAAAGDQLLINQGAETPIIGVTPEAPAYWSQSSWKGATSTTTSTFTYDNTDAHSGTHSLKVQVANYQDGDSKWIPQMTDVVGGKYYEFSDWYKSTANTAVSVWYETAAQVATPSEDDGQWANLFSGIAPASEWTQYKTGFTMPKDAVRAMFVHFIARNGTLQTDDYSVKEQANPTGFSTPMVSLSFDDGSADFYQLALPELDKYGFKSTQYIPTGGYQTAAQDPFLMTPANIRTMYQKGHEIASHSVTHPDLTTKTGQDLVNEVTEPKTFLESLVPVTVDDFAYPFGAYDANTIAALKAAGYTMGRSVEEGYNSKLDLEPFDIRVQNMLNTTTDAQFKQWVDYAAEHNYWLTIVYHEIHPTGTANCAPGAVEDGNCVGQFETTMDKFQSQMKILSDAGMAPNIKTVKDAFTIAQNEIHGPSVGSVSLTPTDAKSSSVLTAKAAGFVDPDGDALTYAYKWSVNGTVIAGETGSSFDASKAGNGNAGDTVSVSVTAKDAAGHVSKAATAMVTLAADPVVVVPDPGTGGTNPGGTNPGTGTTNPGGTNPGTGITGPGNVNPQPAGDTISPVVKIKSPSGRRYTVGTKLTIKFTCTDNSGSVTQKAQLFTRGTKRALRSVRLGQRVKLSKAGLYELRVTATDKAGNSTTKSVLFRVVAPKHKK